MAVGTCSELRCSEGVAGEWVPRSPPALPTARPSQRCSPPPAPRPSSSCPSAGHVPSPSPACPPHPRPPPWPLRYLLLTRRKCRSAAPLAPCLPNLGPGPSPPWLVPRELSSWPWGAACALSRGSSGCKSPKWTQGTGWHPALPPGDTAVWAQCPQPLPAAGAPTRPSPAQSPSPKELAPPICLHPLPPASSPTPSTCSSTWKASASPSRPRPAPT